MFGRRPKTAPPEPRPPDQCCMCGLVGGNYMSPRFPVKFCAGCSDHPRDALHRKCPRCGHVEIIPVLNDRDRVLVELGADQVVEITYRGVPYMKPCACDAPLPAINTLRAEDPICLSCGRSWLRS